jgi:hypothetical protein
MKRRQRNLIRGAVGKTLDGLGSHVRLPNATSGGKSQSQVGSEPTLRVELLSDIHPGSYANAQLRNANKWANAKLTGTPQKIIADREAADALVPGSTLEVRDVDGICFGLRGEWIEVTWRNDLGYFVPVAPYGLTRLGRATADVSPAATGTFEVLKRDDSGELVVGGFVLADTDFGAAAVDGVSNDEEVLLVYISDRVRATNPALSESTAGWQVIQISPSEATEVRGYLFKRDTGSSTLGELVSYWDGTDLVLKSFDEQFDTLQYDAGDDELPNTETTRNGVNLTPFDYNGYHQAGPYGTFGLPIGPSMFGLLPTMLDPSPLWFGVEFRNIYGMPGPLRISGTGVITNKTVLITCTDASWIGEEMLQCSGPDADEQPRWARFEQNSIFICPGMDVLVFYAIDFLLFNSYQNINTESESGHAHEYKYPSTSEITLGLLTNYAGASGGSPVPSSYFAQSSGRSVTQSFNEENAYHHMHGVALIRHDGSSQAPYGTMRRLDLGLKTRLGVGTAATAYIDPTRAFIVVMPVRPSLLADVQRWRYNPYDEEGNFSWFGHSIDEPPEYDASGAIVPELGSLYEGMVTYDIDDFATATIDEFAGMPIL